MNTELPSTNSRPLPETPLTALGPLIVDSVIVDGHTFLIGRPDESDKLLNHPVIQSAFAADEYMPYWTDLWPAARMLAKVLLREAWPAGLEALEIGCGLGLPGVAALSRGLRVTFSDYDATALKFAADNARRNGFDNFRLLQMDWRDPPPGLQVPLLLASDLIYELRNVEPIIELIDKILAPDGLCLLTDQDRIPSFAFREAIARSGLHFSTQTMKAGEPAGRRLKGTLYRIRKAPKSSS